MAAHNGLTCGSRVEQNALAEKMKAGTAEHLAFERGVIGDANEIDNRERATLIGLARQMLGQP
ncbi:hypothetical protein ACK8N7_01295 [Streptomyces griseobrunneus]|uniref:hypothetical protein n=1 Tax=Streptomyces microflavus TaxID=1919 RepID=UPI00380D90B6